MSLFDVIKYPIGDPATPAQLDALPKNLYVKWLKEIDWEWEPPSEFIIQLLWSEQTIILRKMILEYDDELI